MLWNVQFWRPWERAAHYHLLHTLKFYFLWRKSSKSDYKKRKGGGTAMYTLLWCYECVHNTILEPIYIITSTLSCVGWIHFRGNYILDPTDTETWGSVNKLPYSRTSKVIIVMYKIGVIRYLPVDWRMSILIVTNVILATEFAFS